MVASKKLFCRQKLRGTPRDNSWQGPKMSWLMSFIVTNCSQHRQPKDHKPCYRPYHHSGLSWCKSNPSTYDLTERRTSSSSSLLQKTQVVVGWSWKHLGGVQSTQQLPLAAGSCSLLFLTRNHQHLKGLHLSGVRPTWRFNRNSNRRLLFERVAVFENKQHVLVLALMWCCRVFLWLIVWICTDFTVLLDSLVCRSHNSLLFPG